MRYPKNISIIKTILVFFRVGYVIFWVTAGLVILLAILMPFSAELQDEFCRIPFGFAMKSVPAEFVLGETTYATQIIRAGGTLQIAGGPLLYSYMGLVTFTLFLAVGLYALGQILRLLNRAKKGDFFIQANAKAMKKISFALITLWALNVFLGMVNSLIIGRHLVSEVVLHTGILGQMDVGDLTLPLLLLVLAEVFRAGISLKEEQDLTV
jgi:hypothetical protein